MRGEDGLGLLGKLWKIKTTSQTFHNHFGRKVCLGGHQHVQIEGKETARSAYYPEKLTNATAIHWKKQDETRRGLADSLHYLAGRV